MPRLTDISRFLCGSDASLRDAMLRLTAMAAPNQFLVVVDADNRLIGSLTDGDVRRALLRGATLEERLELAMRREPLAGKAGNNAENERILQRLKAHSPFLPVVDDDGVVREILVPALGERKEVAALVMAGGFGRRLGERTRATPKPLLPVGGQPILEHILTRLEDNGIDPIYVSVHYLAEQIESFVQRRQSRSAIHLVHEDQPLGTAGALGYLPPEESRPLLVLNGDVLTQLDLRAFIGFHREHGFDATLAVATHEVQIPFGVVQQGEGGIFVGVAEKPVLRHFVSAGIYLLSPDVRQLAERGRQLDMPELLNRAVAFGRRVGLFPIHEYWKDVGRPDDLETADREHRSEESDQ